MEPRQAATDAIAKRVMPPYRSPSTSVGDTLCKVAFVDINVAKTTTPPRTSCRSATSSDSDDESVTSSSPRSRDNEHVPASSTATWSTYVYFYPRHDMTFTHCLLTTSRHIDADVPLSCWPSLPSQDSVFTQHRGRRPARRRDEEAVSSCVASRWRRRINAARTPFWFPVVPSYDTDVRAYFYYPRHDLSYAEVEVSRVDCQPGLDQSSLPFDTILEELADDEASLDDLSAVLEDRKSLVDDYGDSTAQLPYRVVPYDLRSTSSSLSACHSEQPPTQSMTEIRLDDALVALNEVADKSPSATDQEVPFSDRTVMSACHRTVEAILTPVTKLDLKRVEPVMPRQRADSGRTRTGSRSPIRVTMRRSVSDNSVAKGGRRSPELTLSARVSKNQFPATADVEGDRMNDVTADGDQALCSPRSIIPLCAKPGFTCLPSQYQTVVSSAAVLPRVTDDAVAGQEGVTVSQFTHQVTPPSATTSAAERNQRDAVDDQIENTDDNNLVEGLASKPRAEITSPKMTSAGVTSLLMSQMSPSFTASSSEYLTPPTRSDSSTVTTTAVTASDRVTTFCDVGSQTPLSAQLHCADLQPPVRDEPRTDGRPVTASSTFTCLVDPASPQHTEVQTGYPEETPRNTVANGTSPGTQIHTATVGTEETQSPRRPSYMSDDYQVQSNRNVVSSSATISCVYDAASQVPEKTVCGTKTTPSSRYSDTASTTIHTAGSTAGVHSTLEEKGLATGNATLTQVYSVMSPAVDMSVSSSTDVQYLCALRQTEPGGHGDRKLGTRIGRRQSESALRFSDVPLHHSLDRHRTSTTTASPAHPRRRPSIERVDVGGLSAYVAALPPRNQDKSRPPTTTAAAAAVNHRGCAAWRRTPQPNSYVSIWRKRVATYEAFVSRCQNTTTATGTGSRHQHRR